MIFNPRPPGSIVVGHSITSELADLQRTAFVLTCVGGAILLVGLAGGWWLAGRAIRPVQDITAAAQKISASDLSQRINVAETESELGRLAHVLNSTFARLDAAFAQQQQFTSDAAHELRTPVAAMLTQIQSTLTRDRSAPEYQETLEACGRSVQRMRRLIESLLELARLDAGQESMKRMTFDLSRSASDAIELVRPLAESRRIEILAELTPASCIGDPERFGQVLTNLLTNAVNHNRESGSVRVETGRKGDFSFVRISDDGPGIAPEHLPHIFERFYRADSSRTAGRGGAGLGLAISKAIIEAHSGTIEVSSELGKGTIFTVRIPG
jgi:heavy metal sensor kinase